MFTSYVQNSTQSASDKNASKTWSPALKEHKIDVVEALRSVCPAHFLRAALLHRMGLHRHRDVTPFPWTRWIEQG